MPKGTVERYSKCDMSPEEIIRLSIGRKAVLSPELENELVQYALAMEGRFCGLRVRNIKRLAYQLAVRNHADFLTSLNARGISVAAEN